MGLSRFVGQEIVRALPKGKQSYHEEQRAYCDWEAVRESKEPVTDLRPFITFYTVRTPAKPIEYKKATVWNWITKTGAYKGW